MFSYNLTLTVLITVLFCNNFFVVDALDSPPNIDINCCLFSEKTVFRDVGTLSSVFANTLFHSRWTKRSRVPLFHKQRLVLLHVAVLLLSNSYAPEPNPGPQNHEPSEATGNRSSWLCGTCDCTVSWGTKGVACNNCGQWFHAHCQSIDTRCYQNLEELGEEVPWFCAIYGSPNSKTVYDLHSLEHSSVYSLPELPEDCTTPTEQHMDRSLHSSTLTRASQQDKWKRRPLRLININCHSAVGKKPEISNLIDSTKPDVIVSTETWLDPSIKNNTILPDKL